MGFLDSLRSIIGNSRSASKASGGGQSSFGGAEAGVYWVYAQCQRCGEPLKGRVNLANDPSLDEDGASWLVRKGLVGSGKNYCFQTVEVTLHFNPKKTQVTSAEVSGGKLLTAEAYEALLSTA